jgi:hypothetical protein
MENRFDHIPPEEKQGWGAYATPPQLPGKQSGEQANTLPVLPSDLTMCDRVREKLPYLLENEDSELSADMSRALYGHLGVCVTCSREFDDHQRMIAYLESAPAVEMPMDFTGVIQRRIQVQSMSADAKDAIVTQMPGMAAGSVKTRAFGTPTTAVESAGTIAMRTLKANATVLSTLNKTRLSTTHQMAKLEQGMFQRLTSGSITAALMAYFVSSAWGREMLGDNIAAVRAWLDTIASALGRIPLFGRLVVLVFAALSQVGDLLGDTYHTVGDMAVRGVAMDIGVCMAAYYFLVVRRQRDSSWIRRA